MSSGHITVTSPVRINRSLSVTIGEMLIAIAPDAPPPPPPAAETVIGIAAANTNVPTASARARILNNVFLL
jgi:hypothetical protein